MKLKHLTIIAAIAFAATPIHAQDFAAKKLSPAGDECLEDARTGGAVGFCLGVELGTQENRIDAAYARVSALLADNQRIDLRNQKRDWQKKQTSFCTKKGADKLARTECMALTAKARADQLETLATKTR